ncbi:MAG: hypothetical protein ACYDFU_10370 [Nitrospirota bacterium]
MSFLVGDIPLFEQYQFTDTGETAKHFGLVLLPETATKYQSSLLCCVITSQKPRRPQWSLPLQQVDYTCFKRDSHACFDRKDLVSMSGLGPEPQPKGKLNKADLKSSYKILKKSLFAIKDLANEPFLRGAVIYQWKKALGLIP